MGRQNEKEHFSDVENMIQQAPCSAQQWGVGAGLLCSNGGKYLMNNCRSAVNMKKLLKKDDSSETFRRTVSQENSMKHKELEQKPHIQP